MKRPSIRRVMHMGVIAMTGAMACLGLGACSVGNAQSDLAIGAEGMSARAAPLTIGVGTHFGIGGEYGYDPARSAKAIQTLNVDSFRDDLAWSWFEKPGLGQGAMPAKVLGIMHATPVRPLLILTGGHPAVNGAKPPVSGADVTKYAAFARAAQAKSAAAHPIYEVWNEWNLLDGLKRALNDGAGQPGDTRSAANYARLAKAAVAAMRQDNRQSTILVGAAGLDPGWRWVRAIVGDGVLKGASGLSVHLYNHCDPDRGNRTAANLIDQLDALQPMLRQQTGKTVPVYLTEVGWPTASSGGCSMTPETSADNMAQMLFWGAATPWLKGTWLYQLKDQGRNLAEPEDNFGLFTYDYTPKPAACTVARATRFIKDATAWKVARPSPNVFVLTARTAKGLSLVAWTNRPDTKAVLDFGGANPSYDTLCGGKGMNSRVALGPRPTIIDLNGVDVKSIKVTG